jgi:ClpP class serine protease
MYGLFVADVARGRATTAADVRGHYGEGRVLTAKEAKAAGMIDRVASVEETIRRLSGARAEADLSLEADSDPIVPADSAPSAEYSVGNSLAAKRLRLDLLEKIH